MEKFIATGITWSQRINGCGRYSIRLIELGAGGGAAGVQLKMLIRELQSRRPDYAPGGGLMVVMCKNCGNATWSLHSDGDDELWGCDRCHMAPMSDEQAMALRRARAERAALA